MQGPDDAYITPETTAPLQAAGQVCLQLTCAAIMHVL